MENQENNARVRHGNMKSIQEKDGKDKSNSVYAENFEKDFMDINNKLANLEEEKAQVIEHYKVDPNAQEQKDLERKISSEKGSAKGLEMARLELS